MTRTERRRRQQRRRRAAMQRAACLALAFLAVAAAFAGSGRPQEPETPEATVPVTATALPAEAPTLEPITLEFEDQEAIDPMEASKVALAKMVWGEARGCSTTEQAATIWCVLNRYDSADRRTITVQSTAKCSLTPTDPVTTSLYITNAPSTGELLVAEMVPQVPGQLALDGEEQDHPKILKFKRQA